VWDPLCALFDKVRLISFHKIVHDYVAEHLGAALEVLMSMRQTNSEDSLERSAAIQQQTQLFEGAADLIP
jgi:hypothetical protein